MASTAAPGASVVLVVEDETLLRFQAIDVVEDAGYVAIESTNARDAIRLLESRNDICAIFSDINLEGPTTGLELAAIVRRRWPRVEILLTSGLVYPDQSQMPERSVFFSKPYVAASIVTALRSMVH